jgi:hypothetical protein
MVSLFNNCRLFQENRVLLAQPNYDVRSRVSVDSFRAFVGAIGGTEPDITEDNASEFLSDEFKYAALLMAVAVWRAAHPSPDGNTRLITASFDKSHDRSLCLLDRKVGRLHRATIEVELAKAAEVVKSIHPGNTVFLRTAAKDINLAARQRRSLGHEMCTLDGKERLVVPTHYAIRTNNSIGYHLKLWFVETSTGGKNLEEVNHKEDHKQLNGSRLTGIFGFAGGGACRFIRLVNIGNNHYG